MSSQNLTHHNIKPATTSSALTGDLDDNETTNTTLDGQLIRLTHYINPHLFWFKTERSFLFNNNLIELEYKLQKYVSTIKEPNLFGYKPQEAELIIVMHLPWNKWVRAKVDKILEYSDGKKYILWAIDHGVPLQSISKWLRQIPKDLANIQIESVFKGGLANCVPAEIGFNYEKFKSELTTVKKWSENGCNIVERLLFDASSIKFVQKYIIDDCHRFGEIEIEAHTGKHINPSIILEQLNHSTTIIETGNTNSFYIALSKCETRSMLRWQNNNGHVVFKFMENSQTNQPPKENLEIEQGYSNEMDKVHQKIDDWHLRNNEELNVISDDDLMDSVSVVASRKIAKQSPPQQKPTPVLSYLRNKHNSTSNDENLDHANVDDIDGEYFMQRCGRNFKMSLTKSMPPFPKEVLLPEPPSSIILQNTSFTNDTGYQNNFMVAPSTAASTNNPLSSNNAINYERLPARLLAKLAKKLNTNEINTETKEENIDKKPYVPAGYGLNDLHNFNKLTVEVPNKNIPSKSTKNPIKLSNITKKNDTDDDDDEIWTTRSNRIQLPKDQSNNYENRISSSIAQNQINRLGRGSGSNGGDIALNHNINKHKNQRNQSSSFTKNPENDQCIANSLFLYRILVHGSFQPQWIDGIKNANFCEDVYKEMELLRLTSMYRIQSVAWPHIMRGNSFVVVNSAGTGKTVCYLPAICSIIKEKYDEDIVTDSYGPIGIIVCRSSQQVNVISERCQRFFNNKLKVVKAQGKRDLKKFVCELINGCAILITTAPCLARLINEDSSINLFDRKRVQHLIIDDLDLICCRYQNELINIITKFCVLEKLEKYSNVQMIVTSRTWKPMLEIFFKISMNPILCIGAYIESAMYAKSKIKIQIIENNEKCNKLMLILMNIPFNERTIIICNKTDEVNEIILRLKIESKDFVYCYDQSTDVEISLAKEWNKKIYDEYPILVCTDGVLNEIDVTSAQNIIHYSMPETWSSFSYRFSASFNYYDDLVINKISTKPLATSFILLDENNNEQLPRLVEFLKSHGRSNINEAVLNLAKKLRAQIEDNETKRMVQFCNSLLLLGECTENRCQQRHVLTAMDRSNDYIPTSGVVRLQILYTHSPTHYSARILSYKPIGSTEWTKLSISNNCWQIKMLSYYTNIKNHVNHFPINIGDLCVISEDIMGNSTYYRCRIIEVFKQGIQTCVKVYYIDVGKPIITCFSGELLHLVDEFKFYPQQAIDIRISNIVPYDFDKEWDSVTQKTVKSWLEKNTNDKVHIQGRIEFTVLNCLWLYTISLVENCGKLPIQSKRNSSYLTETLSIRDNLLMKEFGITDDKCLNNLKKMAEIAGIPIDSKTTKEKDKNIDYVNKENISKNIEIKKEIIIKTNENNIEQQIQSTSKPSIQYRGGRGRFLTKTPIRQTSLSNLLKNKTKLPDFGCDDNESSLDCTSTSSTTTNTSSNSLSLSYNTTTDQDDGANNKIEPNSTEKWEYLQENEFHDIFISTFYSPNIFYVQKFSLTLDNLYDEIDAHMEKILLINDEKYIITEPAIGLICLAKLNGENYNRAKIISISCDNDGILIAKVFFVDLGQKTNCSVKEIYQIPDYLVEYLPFQAIRCKLIGIHPPNFNENDDNNENNKWPSEICDKMYTEFLEPCAHNILRPIFEIFDHHTKDDMLLKEQKSYECVLIDCDSFAEDIIFNEQFVKLDLAKYNLKTKHHIDIGKSFNQENLISDNKKMNNHKYNKNNSDDNDNNEENWNDNDTQIKSTFDYKKLSTMSSNNAIKLNDIDVQFTNDELMELLNLPPTAKFIPKSSSPTIEEITEEVVEQVEEDDRVNINECKDVIPVLPSLLDPNLSSEESELDSSSTNTDDNCDDSPLSGVGDLKLRRKRKKKTSKSIPMPSFSFQQKTPKIQWKQTDCLILITIEAPDVKEYFLHVTNSSLQFCAKIYNEDSSVFLNFFGCLDTEFTSHEIRGLNIHIRLMKTLRGIQWPKLIASTDNYHWLKYNIDAIEFNDQKLSESTKNLWTKNDNLQRNLINNCYASGNSSDEENFNFEPTKLQYQDPADPCIDDFD